MNFKARFDEHTGYIYIDVGIAKDWGSIWVDENNLTKDEALKLVDTINNVKEQATIDLDVIERMQLLTARIIRESK